MLIEWIKATSEFFAKRKGLPVLGAVGRAERLEIRAD